MMKTVSIFFHRFFSFFLSFPLCAFSNVLILRDIFFLLLHNKEADRRLLCSQIAHYLVINLTKASPPRSTESTCSAAPLPVITKHAFLICRPRVRVHKQFALRKVLGWFWIIKSWLMLFLCVKERMWSECSETTHWGSERSRCMLTYDAFICSKRGRGGHWSVLPGGVRVSVPARSVGSASNILTGVPDGALTSHCRCAPKENKQWRRSCQHPNCLEVLHLLALDGLGHCKHTWSAELYPVNCVLKAEFTHRQLTPGCEKVNLVPLFLSAALRCQACRESWAETVFLLPAGR